MALWNQSTPEETSEKPVERPPVVPIAPVQSAPILPPKPTMVSVGRERDETIFGSGVTIEIGRAHV